ncbi:hypothetical protein JB92DRAFT_3018111 [Gautieria morchelliformis]|nr:hypothetical protein JB92DRAFT_3018111 [Gautieria morchelliformis]
MPGTIRFVALDCCQINIVSSTLCSHPKPFKCQIEPKSAHAINLIRYVIAGQMVRSSQEGGQCSQ